MTNKDISNHGASGYQKHASKEVIIIFIQYRVENLILAYTIQLARTRPLPAYFVYSRALDLGIFDIQFKGVLNHRACH